eukprot:3181418-Amphidinium_carterae.1
MVASVRCMKGHCFCNSLPTPLGQIPQTLADAGSVDRAVRKWIGIPFLIDSYAGHCHKMCSLVSQIMQ